MAPLQQAAALAYPSHMGFAKSGEAPFHPKFFGKFLVCALRLLFCIGDVMTHTDLEYFLCHLKRFKCLKEGSPQK